MEPVLLGIAGASAANAGNLLERSARAVLEPFANVLRAAASSFSPVDNELEVEAESPVKVLADRIEKALSTAGIEITEPLELAVSDGQLVVVGNHPQRTLIEAALAQDPTLGEEVSQLLRNDAKSSDAGDEYFFQISGQQSRHVIFSLFAGDARLELA